MVVSKTWQHCKRSSKQLNCAQYDQLILRKIIKIVATRCHILRLKCTKFDFGWGSAQTLLGSLQRSPGPLAGFKGSYNVLLRGWGRGDRKGGEGMGRERGGRGKERGRGKRGGYCPPFQNPKYATACRSGLEATRHRDQKPLMCGPPAAVSALCLVCPVLLPGCTVMYAWSL